MTLQLAKVVTALTEEGWSQIHTFCPEQKEKLVSRGHLLAVIVLAGAEKEKATAWGRETIARLHEEYYGPAIGGGTSPLTKLKQVIEKVAAEVKPESQLEVTAASLIGDVLYVAILGQGRLILRRKGKVATILAGSASSPVLTASGHLQNEDFFLLGSGDFFQLVPEETVRKALSAGSVNEAAEILAPIAHESDGNRLVAAVVARVGEEKEVGQEKPHFGERIRLKFEKYLNGRPLYLRKPEKEKSKKTLFTVALILFLLLGVSVILGKQQRRHSVQKQKLATFLEQIRDKKEEGEAIIELNPVRAKELLLEAQNLLQQAEAEGDLDSNLSQLKEELENLLPQVLREHEVQPELFFDLVLIKDGATANEAAFSADNLFILDKAKSSIYRLSLSDKKSAIVAAGEKLEKGLQIAAFWPQTFVLTDQGIVRIEKEDKKQTLVIDADETWGKIIDFQVFGGNLYLLTEKTIWQYLMAEGGFGSKRNWLKQKVDFSEAVSMAIDGSIWVLKSDGTILKFIQGIKEAFGVAGLDKPIKNPKAIFTNENTEFLYILDNGNSRVVVLEKSGEYHAQYLWSGINEATGLAVSGQTGKIFLFSQNKIYAISLK